MSTSDADLVNKARRGDQAAIAEIYDRYADRLFGFTFSLLRDREEAADAVHDVILRSSQKLDQLRDPHKLRPWLFSIARNEVMSRMRQRSRRDNREVPDMAADLPDNDASLLQNELQQLVWDAANGLQPRDRHLLELQMQGLEGEELADALGIKVSHVHVLSSRMRDRMEKAVGSLLIARLGRDDCEKLDTLLSDWDGRFSLDVRSKVTRHIEDCEICTKKRGVLCAPGSIAMALPFVALPVTLKSKVLNSVEEARSGQEPPYTNPNSTQWKWDTHTGFPTRTSLITKPLPVRKLFMGTVFVAAVLTGVLIATANTNNESETISPAEPIKEIATVESPTSPELLQGEDKEPPEPQQPNRDTVWNYPTDPELVETTQNYTCIEGDYCSFDAFLSQDPLDIVTLSYDRPACLGQELQSDNDSIRWDSRTWESVQKIRFYANDNRIVDGNRTCQITFSLVGAYQSIEPNELPIVFTIIDNDKQNTKPTPTPSGGLTINTTDIAFGNQANSQELVITNTSNTLISWTLSIQGSQNQRFATTKSSGRIAPNERDAIKIMFDRSQETEGDYAGEIRIEGNGQTFQVQLSAQIEIPPQIEFFYSEPKVVYTTDTNCGNNTATVAASVIDESPLTVVEVEWTRNGIDTVTTPLKFTNNQMWLASLSGFESQATPSIEAKLTVIDARGNQSQRTTVIGVRIC